MTSLYRDPNHDVELKRAEIAQELEANQELWEAYKEHREPDVQNLIKSYALAKARLVVQGNYTQMHYQKLLDEWNKRAWFALGEIQHKKLFDMQCRWRSGQLELDGLETSYHFTNLARPILDIDILPPITEEDLDKYLQFLNSSYGVVNHYYYLTDHQHYDQIKEMHEKSYDGMPAYYEFHYTVCGNTALLNLPNIKGEEERRLILLALERLKENDQNKKPAQTSQKKFLNYATSEEKIKLAHFLGEKEVARFIRDLDVWAREKPSFETDWAMDYLSLCYPEPVPMPSASNWQNAIEKAALDHITSKVHEMLPVIYDEYLLKKKLGSPIGYVDTERMRGEQKPVMMVWMEVGAAIERGEQLEIKKAFEERKKW